MSMMVSFVLSFFPRDVLDEILNLIGSVSEGFPSYSFTQYKLDPAVFYIQEDKNLRGVICCHVDDFLHAGDQFLKD